MKLFFIRHGQPIYNPDSLTPFGKIQAQALAPRLEKCGITRVFASTSNRAIQTAEPTATLLKKEITLLDFCHEEHAAEGFSVFNDKGERVWAFFHQPTRELFADKSIRLNEKWYEDERFQKSNFKSGVEFMNKHLDEWVLSLGYRHDREKGVYEAINPTSENVALFAHGGAGESFLSSLLDIPYPALSVHFDYLVHTGVTIIEFEDDKRFVIPKVLTYCNDGHLYKEDVTVTK